jgi:RNA polymerase sigma-70 factor (ECF subfamily)
VAETQTTQLVQDCLRRLAAGDAKARDALVAVASDRLRALTRRMLRDYPGVRRWEETDDVMQNALVRLCRALAAVRPATPRDFFRVAAVQVRRELIDLARHYYGPEGLGARYGGDGRAAGPDASSGPGLDAADSTNDPDRLALWTEFHEKVEALPAEEREAFDLLWYQELSQPEAAALLGVSERTLRRRWQSARRRLHDFLQGRLPD